jgi:hypothetical protein
MYVDDSNEKSSIFPHWRTSFFNSQVKIIQQYSYDERYVIRFHYLEVNLFDNLRMSENYSNIFLFILCNKLTNKSVPDH